jgi:DNA-binding response OmpR family regulator
MSKILIVEDEALLRELVRDYLERDDHIVIEAKDGREGLQMYYQNDDIDLILLDVMMPEYDGWAVIKEIRKEDDLPIIMLTAMSQDSDELYGFELGANDYVTKPFKPHILMARVKAQLRKRETAQDKDEVFFGALSIDKTARRINLTGKPLELSPKEYDLLIYLTQNAGVALSRNQILDGVWGYDYYGDLRTVDTHIKRLRIKLGEKAYMVKTVRGYGYRFEVEQ